MTNKDANKTLFADGAPARVRLSFMSNYNLTKANRHGTITRRAFNDIYIMEVAGRTIYIPNNQFRVDPPWAIGDKDFIIPDIVLFINGIPIVVVDVRGPLIRVLVGWSSQGR